MTRKNAVRIEKQMKAAGVYKPFVSEDDDFLSFESYPLTAIVSAKDAGFDPERGPYRSVKLHDCSLPRAGFASLIETDRIYFGTPIAQRVAQLLMQHHVEAHARAEQQDWDALRCA